MADGLLLTQRERMRLWAAKLAAALVAPVVLGIAALALGAGAVGWMILILGALIACFIASSARAVRSAAIGGVVVAIVLFLFQLVVAHIASHPIE